MKLIQFIKQALSEIFSHGEARGTLYYFLPLRFFTFLVIYLLLWHFALVWVASWASIAALRSELISLTLQYSLISLAFCAGAVVMFVLSRERKRARTVLLLLFVAVFFLSAVIRGFDWATIYFAGQHVDNEFWFHAFYTDGTTFVLTPVAGVLTALIFFTTVLVARYLLKLRDFRVTMMTPSGQADEMEGRLRVFGRVMAANGLLAIAFPVLMTVFLIVFPGKKNRSIDRSLFSRIPETMVISSFVDYAFSSPVPKKTMLSKEVISKLEKCGVRLFSGDQVYPLMKKSIYLESGSKNPGKPSLPMGTNVIIIFAESLSQYLLQEEEHGVRGLTPNFHAMMAEGYYFTNMYSAAFPTIRGIIATLGSSLYLVSKVRGIQKNVNEEKMKGFRPPIPCRFLLLSDILKKYGYTNIHVQGGSGTFVGMKSAFINRQSYDRFYAWESLELQAFAKNTRKKDWGIRDEDVFRYAVKLLKDRKTKTPFLLTISTIDMHPPYDPLYTHPNAGGNDMLNSLYCADRAFGLFWEYFKSSNFKENTLLIVVADHAAGPGAEQKKFFAQHRKAIPGKCDFIPCIMNIPGDKRWKGEKNKTLCSNLDILPTILEMMNIDMENPFLGLSVLSERPGYPLAITGFYTVDDQIILGRMTEAQRREVRKLNWTEKNQEIFLEFIEGLEFRRSVYPDREGKGAQ